MDNWIGTAQFDARFPDGSRERVRFRVGRPYRTAEPDEWACEVELHGLMPPEPPVLGGDSMQALSLAISWAGRCMRRLSDAGVRYFDADSETSFSWSAYFDVDQDPDAEAELPQSPALTLLAGPTRPTPRVRRRPRRPSN